MKKRGMVPIVRLPGSIVRPGVRPGVRAGGGIAGFHEAAWGSGDGGKGDRMMVWFFVVGKG